MMSRFATASMLVALFVVPLFTYSQSAEEVQRQIDEHSAQIQALDKEIAQYQVQLDATTEQKNTLQNAVNQLNLSIKKTAASIKVTQNQIGSTELQIKQLSGNIADTQASIAREQAGLEESLRRLSASEAQPLALQLLAVDGLSGAWREVEALSVLQSAIQSHVLLLGEKKDTLTDKKTTAEEKRAQLIAQQRKLQAQQGSLNAQKAAQSDLLAQTKSQESAYQSIIVQKQAEKESFQKALFELASQLEYTLDPAKVPSPGSGILRWPLDNVFVTQQYGKTSSSGRLYTSGTHEGIDLRASIGTPVRAALSGTVLEANQGAIRNCQYGKWVLIRHMNGLSTLYAHLSDIRVGKGATVTTGQLIGYSGDTGYATGPHLHFTVYAADAVTFKNYTCKSGRKTFIPIANPSAYLNPMNYLSSL